MVTTMQNIRSMERLFDQSTQDVVTFHLNLIFNENDSEKEEISASNIPDFMY